MPETQKPEMTLWRLLKQWIEDDLGLQTKIDLLRGQDVDAQTLKVILMNLQVCEVHFAEYEAWTTYRGVISDPIRIEHPDFFSKMKAHILSSVVQTAGHFEFTAQKQARIAQDLRNWVNMSKDK